MIIIILLISTIAAKAKEETVRKELLLDKEEDLLVDSAARRLLDEPLKEELVERRQYLPNWNQKGEGRELDPNFIIAGRYYTDQKLTDIEARQRGERFEREREKPPNSASQLALWDHKLELLAQDAKLKNKMIANNQNKNDDAFENPENIEQETRELDPQYQTNYNIKPAEEEVEQKIQNQEPNQILPIDELAFETLSRLREEETQFTSNKHEKAKKALINELNIAELLQKESKQVFTNTGPMTKTKLREKEVEQILQNEKPNGELPNDEPESDFIERMREEEIQFKSNNQEKQVIVQGLKNETMIDKIRAEVADI